MSKQSLQIRPGDCDAFGHVNNAVYIALMEQALANSLNDCGYGQDWATESHNHWQLREMHAEYRRPATFGDTITAQLWLEHFDSWNPTFGLEIRRTDAAGREQMNDSVFRAAAIWQRLDSDTKQVLELPEGFAHIISGTRGTVPRTRKWPDACRECRHYDWNQQVAITDVSPSNLVHLHIVYTWMQQALFDASSQGGWPLDRWQEAGYFTLQIRHDTLFDSFPRLDDKIRITSHIVEAKRLRGAWLQEGYRLEDGKRLFSNISSGVFLNLEGRPATPPKVIMDELRFGGGRIVDRETGRPGN